jgi:hypothetical protein
MSPSEMMRMRKLRQYRIKRVPYSEAAMFSKIAGKPVFARLKSGSLYVYEVRMPTEKAWWGTFTAGELGVKE